MYCLDFNYSRTAWSGVHNFRLARVGDHGIIWTVIMCIRCRAGESGVARGSRGGKPERQPPTLITSQEHTRAACPICGRSPARRRPATALPVAVAARRGRLYFCGPQAAVAAAPASSGDRRPRAAGFWRLQAAACPPLPRLAHPPQPQCAMRPRAWPPACPPTRPPTRPPPARPPARSLTAAVGGRFVLLCASFFFLI